MLITLDLWGLIAFGIGVWMFMDGLVFGVMPKTMRHLLGTMRAARPEELQQAGLILALIGAAIVFMVLYM